MRLQWSDASLDAGLFLPCCLPLRADPQEETISVYRLVSLNWAVLFWLSVKGCFRGRGCNILRGLPQLPWCTFLFSNQDFHVNCLGPVGSCLQDLFRRYWKNGAGSTIAEMRNAQRYMEHQETVEGWNTNCQQKGFIYRWNGRRQHFLQTVWIKIQLHFFRTLCDKWNLQTMHMWLNLMGPLRPQTCSPAEQHVLCLLQKVTHHRTWPGAQSYPAPEWQGRPASTVSDAGSGRREPPRENWGHTVSWMGIGFGVMAAPFLASIYLPESTQASPWRPSQVAEAKPWANFPLPRVEETSRAAPLQDAPHAPVALLHQWKVFERIGPPIL